MPTSANRVQCQTNAQGHLLRDLIDCTGHYAVSLCDLVTGPTHTFYGSGGRNTTVDFCSFGIGMWGSATPSSDHLAVKVKLDWQPEKYHNQRTSIEN